MMKKKTKEFCAENGFYLDLPEAPDFVSEPPSISLAKNIALCEQMLAVWNKNREENLLELPILTEPFYL